MPQVADTDSVGYTDVTGGSRVTFATGLAAYEVGLGHRAADARAGRHALGVRAERGASAPTACTAATASRSRSRSWPASCTTPAARSSAAPRSIRKGSTNGFGAHIVDVEVDPETGKTTVLRYTAMQDAGKAIHPSYVEGQMQGGSVQGIGWALNEEYFFNDQGPDDERQLPRLPHADRRSTCR